MTGGSSMAAIIYPGAATIWAAFDIAFVDAKRCPFIYTVLHPDHPDQDGPTSCKPPPSVQRPAPHAIAGAGPSAPCSIAPSRRTSRPGSRARVTNKMAHRRRPMWSASSGATLECGILAHGFARARCGECGHDFLIAFSCKGRGVCPACNARRMAETRRIWPITSFPACQCASGCCRSRSGCATFIAFIADAPTRAAHPHAHRRTFQSAQDFPRSWPTAVGGGRFRSGWQRPQRDPSAQPQPAYEFDQRIAW
jgi:Transposase zinc-binding domain